MSAVIGGAARRFSAERFGGSLRILEAFEDVGTETVIAVKQDPDRVALLVTNIGSTQLTFRFRSPVTAGEGILLPGNGDTLSLDVERDGDTVAWRLFGISAVAGGRIHVVETVREG